MIDTKVLLIDDDAELLQLATVIFKKEGAQVITALDGMEGVSKLFTHHPDLIILDVMMPGMNGFEVCERIRQVSDTPLIMLTALNHEQEMLRGLEAGADVVDLAVRQRRFVRERERRPPLGDVPEN